MVLTFLGVTGFVLLFICDFASVRKHPRLRSFIAAGGGLLICLALILVCAFSPGFTMPPGLSIAGIVIATVFSLLGFYSILLEIPKYVRSRRRKSGDRLMTAGTYALARHPGVLWYALALLGLLMAFPSCVLLVSIPIWIALDVFLAAFEEKFHLSVVFGERYARYKKSVPFLIPTAKSIKAFWKGIFPNLPS